MTAIEQDCKSGAANLAVCRRCAHAESLAAHMRAPPRVFDESASHATCLSMGVRVSRAWLRYLLDAGGMHGPLSFTPKDPPSVGARAPPRSPANFMPLPATRAPAATHDRDAAKVAAESQPTKGTTPLTAPFASSPAAVRVSRRCTPQQTPPASTPISLRTASRRGQATPPRR